MSKNVVWRLTTKIIPGDVTDVAIFNLNTFVDLKTFFSIFHFLKTPVGAFLWRIFLRMRSG